MMATTKQRIKQMARNAKRMNWSRNKAERAAPCGRLHEVFMAEFDRYQPRPCAYCGADVTASGLCEDDCDQSRAYSE